MLKKNYFRGCYFKCISKDTTVAFIPALHRGHGEETASLQIIMNDAVYNIPFNTLKYSEKPLYISLNNCVFTEEGIRLNIKYNKLIIKGKINFYNLSPINYDIMGPFHLVPFMQCRHYVYSMRHLIKGQISINSRKINFNNGIGYIEGDSGSSFPQHYIWTQCCFNNSSIMLAIADIPFLGLNFTGIIGVVLLDGKEYRIATYLGAKIKYLENNTVAVTQGGYELSVRLINRNDKPLFAPESGSMTRTIHESAACTAYYKFSYKGNLLCEFKSDRASFEFEYII